MDLYKIILEDFDWSIVIDIPHNLQITESYLQLYMHDDLESLMNVSDEKLIPILKQPRGEMLLFMVQRFKVRLRLLRFRNPSAYKTRVNQKQRAANHKMAERLQKILCHENNNNPPETGAMIQMDQDLRLFINQQRWDEVQRLLKIVPEETFLPILTDDTGWTLLHEAVDAGADLSIVKHLTKVFAPGDMRRIRVREYTALHRCYEKCAPTSVRDHILATWPPAAFMYHLQNVLNQENGAKILSNLIDACPGAIDYIHQYGYEWSLEWCWKTLLHLAIPYYLPETDDASAKFNDELDSLISLLLLQKPELADAIDEELRTPLHLACSSHCSVATVKRIMACLSVEQMMECDSKRENALHYAMSASFDHPGRLEIVGALLYASYDLIYQEADDIDNCTPIDFLLENTSVKGTVGLARCFETIFAHGPHSHMTRSGALILHAALYDKCFSMRLFRTLVSIVPEQVMKLDDVGNLPIHLAAKMEKGKCRNRGVQTDYIEILGALLDLCPEGLSTPNHDGKLPLQVMVEAGGRWHGGIKKLVQLFPAAVYDLHLQGDALAALLSRLDRRTMYALLRDMPQMLNA